VQPAARQWRFNVLLDGKPIGEHAFIVTRRDDALELLSQARFTVRMLFVPLYRYEHESREVWRDGCLARIEARTRDNGEERVVRGARREDRFEVEGPNGTATLPACIKSFAYWDAAFLQERRLLNPQTGEYDAVEVTNLGSEQLFMHGGMREAARHRLQAGDFHIDVWYSREGEWLALESQTPEGRRLRYEMR
jgi:hypothetical protein